jgi:hypothetical protein
MRVCAMRTARVWLARERQESVYYYTSIRSGQHHGGNRRRNRRRPAAALHNLRCGWGRGLSADNWMWWPPINRVMDPSSDPVCIYPILPPDCCTETKCNPFPYKLLLGRFFFPSQKLSLRWTILVCIDLAQRSCWPKRKTQGHDEDILTNDSFISIHHEAITVSSPRQKSSSGGPGDGGTRKGWRGSTPPNCWDDPIAQHVYLFLPSIFWLDFTYSDWANIFWSSCVSAQQEMVRVKCD